MKKENQIMLILLLCFPFIDLLTSIATWENLPSLGIIIKAFLLIYAVYYILKNTSSKRKIYILFSVLIFYGMLASIFIIQNKDLSIITEISNLIKIFYLPILLLFFNEYQNPKITKKTITIILLLYLLFYLIPYPFNLGHNISEIYPNKNLYLSYFYIGNEIANIFILLIPIAITYLIEEKRKFLIPILFLILAMVLLLGTKTMYISLIIIILFLLIYYRKIVQPVIVKHWWKIFIPVIILIIGIIVYIPKTAFYQNIKTTFEYYEVDNLQELLSIEKINNIIYSNRLTFLENIHNIYKESSVKELLFGLGRTKINQNKDIEIDVFDIFYSIGIIGFIMYISFFIIVLKRLHLKPLYKFVFTLLFIISLFSGHVLISPMVSTYLGILPLISKNEKGVSYERLDKKSIKKS